MYIFYSVVSLFFLYSVYIFCRPKKSVKFDTGSNTKEVLFDKLIVYTDSSVMISDSFVINVKDYKFSILKYTIDSVEYSIFIKDTIVSIPDIIVKPPVFINKIKKALIEIKDPPSVHDISSILSQLIGPNYDFYGKTLDVYDILFIYTSPDAVNTLSPDNGSLLLYDSIGNRSDIYFDKENRKIIKWNPSILKPA
jgi:hypothetical protein